MKMTGVRQEVSGNTSSRVQGGGSVNSGPSFRATYCTVTHGRKDFPLSIMNACVSQGQADNVLRLTSTDK